MARYPAALIAFSFAAGIWLQKILQLSTSVLILFFFFILIFLIIFLNKKKAGVFLLVLLIFLLGSMKYDIWFKCHLQHPIQNYLPINSINAVGEIISPSQNCSNYFIAKVHYIELLQRKIELNRRVLVKTFRPVQDLLPGDKFILQNVCIENLSRPRNPGQFNYRAYLNSRGVFAGINMEPYSRLNIKPDDKVLNFHRWMFVARKFLIKKIREILPGNEANFLSAILLGEKENLPEEIKTDFQNSGVAHVLAISGLHVGFVVLIIQLLVSFLPVSFRWHNVFTIFFLVSYMLLTGGKPPVVRATLMVSIYFIGMILERRLDPFNAVFASAFFILFFQPQQLFWIGFQFSYIAVLSILFFYNRMKHLENKIALPETFQKFEKWLKTGIVTPFLVSLAAQLGTIPLMVIYFQKLPLISFFLNIVVIPLVGFIVALGFCALISSLFVFPLAATLSSFLLKIVQLLIWIVHKSASLSFAYLLLPHFSFGMLVIYVLFLILLFGWKQIKQYSLKLALVTLLIVSFLWYFSPRIHSPEILMLDVGQGESSLVRTPRGDIILFDAGPVSERYDSGKDVILPALQYWGKLRIDKAFISHPHLDHIGGIFSLVKSIAIDSVYLPAIQTNIPLQDSLIKMLKFYDIGFRFLQSGDLVRMNGSVKLYVLSPFEDNLNPDNNSEHQVNNTSLVILLRVDGSTVLFTGDAEIDVEKKLLLWKQILDVDILKIGHHGSQTSTSFNFLLQTSPDIALIPVGLNNHFGHPSPVVLRRLRDLSILYYRTDENGAVWLKKIAGEWNIVKWR